MSLVTDIRSVSESVIEQIADQFDDLPRPLLAAIGAGDLAVQSLAALRQSLMEQIATTTVDADGVRSFATSLSDKATKVVVDWSEKAQKAAADLADQTQKGIAGLSDQTQKSIAGLAGQTQKTVAELPAKAQHAAVDLPAKAQHGMEELPGKAQKVAGDVQESIQELI